MPRCSRALELLADWEVVIRRFTERCIEAHSSASKEYEAKHARGDQHRVLAWLDLQSPLLTVGAAGAEHSTVHVTRGQVEVRWTLLNSHHWPLLAIKHAAPWRPRIRGQQAVDFLA